MPGFVADGSATTSVPTLDWSVTSATPSTGAGRRPRWNGGASCDSTRSSDTRNSSRHAAITRGRALSWNEHVSGRHITSRCNRCPSAPPDGGPAPFHPSTSARRQHPTAQPHTTKEPDMHDHDEYIFATDDEPLVGDQCGCGAEDLIFDEEGTLPADVTLNPVIREAIRETPTLDPRLLRQSKRPCALHVLNGSWNLNFRPKRSFPFGTLRGPMRLEATGDTLRASGDVYFRHLRALASRRISTTFEAPTELEMTAGITQPHQLFRRNWYPHYPFNEYRWYFRSTGCAYVNGTLRINFRRHIWDASSSQFAGDDSGWMRFTCERNTFRHFALPQPTTQMTGEAMIGGVPYTVTATKTSPYYRGCVVEVDVMTNRDLSEHCGRPELRRHLPNCGHRPRRAREQHRSGRRGRCAAASRAGPAGRQRRPSRWRLCQCHRPGRTGFQRRGHQRRRLHHRRRAHVGQAHLRKNST